MDGRSHELSHGKLSDFGQIKRRMQDIVREEQMLKYPHGKLYSFCFTLPEGRICFFLRMRRFQNRKGFLSMFIRGDMIGF